MSELTEAEALLLEGSTAPPADRTEERVYDEYGRIAKGYSTLASRGEVIDAWAVRTKPQRITHGYRLRSLRELR